MGRNMRTINRNGYLPLALTICEAYAKQPTIGISIGSIRERQFFLYHFLSLPENL